MYVDDRLATVLNARADGKVAMRIQYRQLLDLVGTAGTAARSDLLDHALLRLAELGGSIPVEERARFIAEPGIRLRNPRLVADLAADHPRIALAAIGAARLGETEWLDLIPALPLAARGFLRQRRDLGPVVDARLAQLGVHDRALPAAEQAQATEAPPAPVVVEAPAPPPAVLASSESPPPPPAPPAHVAATEGIGAIVRRIEAFRRSREAGQDLQAANDAPRLPLGENDDAFLHPHAIRAFSFATDAAGRIGWADAAVAPMLMGLLLPGLPPATATAASPLHPPLAETIRRRQPLRALRVVLDGAPAITGEWQIDATPEFDGTGHFTGYAGRMRRPAPPALAEAPSEADRIRQVLHELRTPVNAIQGYAEMIHQQMAGPAPHEYRALAASIAADAARMLAGFEELERLARLDSGVLRPDPGSADLAMVVAGVVHQLEPHTASRSAGFALEADSGNLDIPLDPAEAERLVWRLLATMAGAAHPGEVVGLAVRREPGTIILDIRLPESLAAAEDLFGAAPPATGQALSAGVFGTGFALRLAGAEARATGGDLVRNGANLQLSLPDASLTAPDHGHTTAPDVARSA